MFGIWTALPWTKVIICLCRDNYNECNKYFKPSSGDQLGSKQKVNSLSRVVTKISSCRVNTTSRRGIKRLGISFGSIFSPFSNKSSRGPLSQQPGKIPGPRLLMTTLPVLCQIIIYCESVSIKLTQLKLNFSYLSFSSCSSKDFCLFFTRKSTINSEGIEGGILNSPPSDRLRESAGLKHKRYCLSYFDCKQSQLTIK